MFNHFRIRTTRVAAALLGTFALVLAIALVSLGVSTSGGSSTPSTQLAAADRHADSQANRGSNVLTLASTTTTTVAPTTTTTVAPTTTTTAAPTTTTTAKPKPPAPVATAAATAAPAHSLTGGASYYSQPWSAKGCAMTQAPKHTVVTVTNIATGKSTTCVVNDSGPYVHGRIIDLDTTIFEKLASTSQGVFQARVTW